MKMLFVHDHVFLKDRAGKTYSNAAFPSYAWNRYLEYFDHVDVIGRGGDLVGDVDTVVLSSRDGVSFELVDRIIDFNNPIKNKKTIEDKIELKVKNSQAVVVRLPSENGLIAISKARKYKKALAIEVVGCAWDGLWNHGSILAKLYAPIGFLRMKKAIAQSDKTLYVTNSFLQKRYPSRCNSLSVSASNIQVSVCKYNPKNKGFSDKTLVIGLIGNYKTRYKGIHVAIEALAKVKPKIPPFQLRVLGKGPTKQYEQMISRLGMEENVFFDGSLPNGTAVMGWLDDIDLYIQPSLQEGLPRALIEAMSRGCICIGSDAGGIPELLSYEFLSPAGRVNDFARLIVQVVGNRNNWPSISSDNHSFSMHYDCSIIEKKRSEFYGALYEEAVQK